MSFGGKKKENREISEKDLYTGWGESRVLAVCPDDPEEIKKLGFFVKDDTEFKYLDKKEKNDRVRIDFYMEEIKTLAKYKKSFWIENEVSISKNTGKTEYVNQTGDARYADDEDNLKESFTKFRKKNKATGEFEIYGDKDYREALIGEGDLLAFIRIWLGGLDYWDVTTSILLDMKRLFKGNFKDLRAQVGGDLTKETINGKEKEITIMDLLGVRVQETENGIVSYQDSYIKSAPGYLKDTILQTDFSKKNIEKWREEQWSKENPNGRFLKAHEEIAVRVTDPEYPWKQFFKLTPLSKYNPGENMAASDTVMSEAEEEESGYQGGL